MSFGASTPPTVLEGDYSTWTEIWEYDFPEGLGYILEVSITFSPDYLNILYKDVSNKFRLAIIGITDASEKFLSPSGSHYTEYPPDNSYSMVFHFNILVNSHYGGACFSILGKYMLILLVDATKIEVWKDGVKAWTSPLASDVVVGASIYEAAGLRYDGKYVIAITDTDKLVCFEGS